MSLLTTHKRDLSYNSMHKMRSAGWIPGIVYGHNFESTSIQVKETELKKLLGKHESVFEINVNSKKHMASVGELQKDAVTGALIHIAFHKLTAGEKVHMKIPVRWIGTAPGIKEGGVFTHMHDEVDIKAIPSKIPEYIEFDISNLQVGETVKVKDLTLGADLELAEHDLDKVLANCNFPKVQAVEEPVAEEAVAGTEESVADSAAEEETKEAS